MGIVGNDNLFLTSLTSCVDNRSTSSILVPTLLTNDVFHRISYCSADAANARVFAVVEGKSGSGASESHVAHVFVCARRKQARALALSLAHAFNDAYQV